MADVNSALSAMRDAVGDLIGAVERSGGTWTAPRVPGKWSPSQVVEHVALSLDEAAKVVSGSPAKYPNLPFFVRPLARRFLFDRVLESGSFPKAKTNKAMNPASGPASPGEARARLEGALAMFDRECRLCASGRVASATFGNVSLVDYARFIELHTRHHCNQMPGAR